MFVQFQCVNICFAISQQLLAFLCYLIVARKRRLPEEEWVGEGWFKKSHAGQTSHTHRGVYPRGALQQTRPQDYRPGHRVEVGREEPSVGEVRQVRQAQGRAGQAAQLAHGGHHINTRLNNRVCPHEHDRE